MKIGSVDVASRLALAPMAGVTDAAFRQICAEQGAGYTVTELVSSKALCHNDKKTFTLLRQFPGEHPAA
ncbi:MAG: tRNA-dihydrouridine synthase, partial [Oscillibacter sp.]|nr:tRNA-dihydrouridine synthase [Oscillibacter sp.]